jgi:hypothetical protein
MSNQDFFAASVNAHRASLQREARSARVARQALRAGRRSAAKASRAAAPKANAVARDHVVTESRRPARADTTSAASGLQAAAVCGS